MYRPLTDTRNEPAFADPLLVTVKLTGYVVPICGLLGTTKLETVKSGSAWVITVTCCVILLFASFDSVIALFTSAVAFMFLIRLLLVSS